MSITERKQLVLAVLQRLRTADAEDDEIRLSRPECQFEADLSDGDYSARARILLRYLGIGEIDLPLLERRWEEELERFSGGVRRSQLLQIARECSSSYYENQDKVTKWRQRLTFWLKKLNIKYSETPPDDSETVWGKPMLEDWPERLLKDAEFATVPSMLNQTERLPIDKAWVPLRFTEAGSFDASASGRPWRDAIDERHAIGLRSSFETEVLLERLSGLTLVLGEPGIGKSTFVKWLAHAIIAGEVERFVLPVVVRLRDFALSSTSTDLLEFGLRQCGVTADDQRTLWKRALELLTDKSRDTVLLLFDGFDELPRNIATRQEVASQIRELSRRFSVVVTSRPAGIYNNEQLRAANTAEVAQLSPASVSQLMSKWFHLLRRPEQELLTLQEHIQLNSDLRRLTRNPFLLVCLCAVAASSFEEKRSLPKTRYEIYRDTIRRIRQERCHGQKRAFEESDLESTSTLAFWLFRDAPGAPRYKFERGDVQKACGTTAFFDDVVEPSRLINKWDINDTSFYFVHATFQEYLSAGKLLDSDDVQLLNEVLDSRIFDSAWQEVFAFLAGRSDDKDALVWKKLRRIASHPDRFGVLYLRLAYWVRETASRDGGVRLMGLDLRDKLWKKALESESDSKPFVNACLALGTTWYADRVKEQRSRLEEHPTGQEIIRRLNEVQTAQSSQLYVDHLLSADTSMQLPPTPMLTEDALERLRKGAQDGGLPYPARVRSIQTLGLAKDEKAQKLLAELAVNDGEVRRASLEAIALIGGGRSLDILKAFYNTWSGTEAQLQAVKAAGYMHDLHVRDWLMVELAVVVVREGDLALQLLMAIQDHPLSDDHAIRVSEFLKSPDPEIRDYAACVLHTARHSNDVHDRLAHAARFDSEETVRTAALLAFERRAHPTDLDWLEAICRNGGLSSEEREAALMAIGDLIDQAPQERPRIRAIISETIDDEGLRKSTVNLWGKFGEEFREQMIELLKTEKDEMVLEEVCRILGEQGVRQAIPHLEECLSATDTTDRAKQHAARALGRIDPNALRHISLPQAERELRRLALESGYLVFDDHIIGPRGERLPDVLPKEQRKDLERLGLGLEDGKTFWKFYYRKKEWKPWAGKFTLKGGKEQQLLALLLERRGSANVADVKETLYRNLPKPDIDSLLKHVRALLRKQFGLSNSKKQNPVSRVGDTIYLAIKIGHAVRNEDGRVVLYPVDEE